MPKKRRLGPTERWVQLKHLLLKSPAWRSLTGNAAKLYVEIAMRYNGNNNGRIPYSVREAAKALNASFQTAMRSLRLLQNRGFIVCTRKGAFSLKVAPKASEWRLTEHSNDTPPEHATKDFMRWQPVEPDVHAPPKSKTRLSRRKRALPPEKPHGCRGGNVSVKKASGGCRGGSVDGQNPPSTFPPEQHLQLPGADAPAGGGERSAPEGSAVASEPPSPKTDRERTPREKLQARQQAENQIADLIGWSCVQEMPPELVEGLCSRWPNIDRAELFELKQKYLPPAAVGGQRARVGAA
jgi:hypothetical protein